MKKVLSWLCLITLVDVVTIALYKLGLMPGWCVSLGLVVPCSLVGGIGGLIYCLRAIYLNISVRKSWAEEWEIWYFIRPLISHLTGGVSLIFIKAGLLALEAEGKSNSTDWGYYALAFIAGYNVDKFMSKLETIAHASWGIEKSRATNVKRK